jgi:NADH:ubiquinone oxidoreductase subunit H
MTATVACIDDPIVPLVQLSRVAPRQIELGDKLEIEGEAFPQGRTARVMFEGAMHRPGDTADGDGDVDLQGEVVAPDRIEINVTDAVVVAFCGAGSNAVHTTFEGAVTVVFAAQQPGAPPVSGNLQHATLDVLPTSVGQARYLANEEDGDKLVRSSGMRVESRASGGLVVTSVEPKSRAQAAGLVPDDVIVASSGVRVIGVADLAPPSGSGSLTLRVQRGSGGSEEALTLPLDGARSETPTRFAVPAVLVSGIALLLALLSASPGRFVVWLRRRLAARRTTSRLPDLLAHTLGLVTAAAIPLLVPSADVGLLVLVLFTGALATALLVGTESERATGRAVLEVASRITPVAAALAGALTLAGSLRAGELVAAQGAAPWGFFALRSPAHAVLAFVCCTWPAVQLRDKNERQALSRVTSVLIATLHAALVVVVFFGGWRLPFVSAHARGGLAWAMTAWFVVKSALVATIIQRASEALPTRPFAAVLHTAWLRLIPLAAAATLGAVLWERHVTSSGVEAATTFGLAALGVAAFVQLAWLRPATRTRVDPLA